MSEEHARSEVDDALTNPAMRQVIKRRPSPAAVAEAMEDPAIFEQIARGDLYIEMARLRELAGSNSMSMSARLSYVQMLSKMGKVDKPEAANNPLDKMPSINIILQNSGQTTRLGSTYESKALEVEED